MGAERNIASFLIGASSRKEGLSHNFQKQNIFEESELWMCSLDHSQKPYMAVSLFNPKTVLDLSNGVESRDSHGASTCVPRKRGRCVAL